MVSLTVADFNPLALPRALTFMAVGSTWFRRRYGLVDAKLLGSGKGGGFGPIPDPFRYSLLAFWGRSPSNDDVARLRTEFTRGAGSVDHFLLRPLQSHGSWGGVDAIRANETEVPEDQPLAVLTRATIRLNRLVEFHRHVPQVSQQIGQASGISYHTSLGEIPWLRQATFSVWRDLAAMKRFSYGDETDHRDVVKKTRSRNWYREELFARFALEDWTRE